MSIGAKPYTYRRAGREAIKGAMIRGSDGRDVFIAAYKMRKISDQLNDIAEQWEQENENK